MNIKNFATFGLFIDGSMINSGSIQKMENEAIRMLMTGQVEILTVSIYGFDGDNIIEETRVLSYRRIKDTIYITNMLLKGEENDAAHID